MVGQTIAHYQITEKLGSGTMGVVYKAWDTNLKRTVALKFLSRMAATDPTAATRLKNEAVAASGLGCDHVQTVHDFCETDDGQVFLVLECYEGLTLKDHLASGMLPAEEAIDIIRQVGLGLSAAHQAGIIHRDIKPANIFLTSDGTVKILDFGLAKFSNSSGLTISGTTLGTTAYLSPEQARGEEVDHRADIWSLGVTFFECLTGEMPFKGDHPQAIIYSILNMDPHYPTEPATILSAPLVQALDKALAKEPDQRYQDIQGFIQDLTDSSGDNLPPPTHQSRRTISFQKLAIALVTVLSLAVLFVGAIRFGWLPGGSDAPAVPPSLAVLVFDNFGPPGDDDYIAASLTEDVIINLSRLKGLDVLSRSAVERYHHKKPDAQSVGDELGVEYVLEGSFRRQTEGIRVTIQLVDARTGFSIWAHQFDGPFADIFTMQDSLTAGVRRALVLSPQEQSAALVGQHWTENVEAYSYYLVGREKYWEQGNPERYIDAKPLFTKALQLDPFYAPALAGLSQCYSSGTLHGRGKPDCLETALALARQAKEIDPELAVAWRAEARALEQLKRFKEAIISLERARELNPLLASVYNLLGRDYFGRTEGGPQKAYETFAEGIALRPYETVNALAYSRLLDSQGKHEESSAILAKSLELSPDDPELLFRLGNSRGERGIELFYGLIRDHPDQYLSYASLLRQLPKYGRKAEADSIKIKMLSRWPAVPYILQIAGRYHRDQGEYPEAENYLRQALALDENLFRARTNLAHCLQSMGRKTEAQAVIDTLLAHWSGLPEVLHQAAQFHLPDPDYQAALHISTEWTQNHPEDARAFFYLGSAQSGLGAYEETLASCKKGMELNWGFYLNYRLFCRTAGRMNVRREEQLSVAQKAVDIWPGKPFSWHLLGSTYENLGKNFQAASAYEKSVELDPYWSGGKSLRSLAIIYYNEGNHNQELEIYQTLLARNPDDIVTCIYLADTAYRVVNDTDWALRNALRVLDLTGNSVYSTCYGHAAAHIILGDIQSDESQQSGADHYALAEQEIRVGLDTYDGNYLYWSFIGLHGLVQARHGELAAARSSARMVLEERGQNKLSCYIAAIIFSFIGDVDEAFAALNMAVDAGYRVRAELENDPDLEAVRQDPRFAVLLDRIK